MHELARQSPANHDDDLELLMERAAQAMKRLGITVQDVLDELPAAQSDVLYELYGSAYMHDIDRRIALYQQQHATQQPADGS